MTGVKAAGRVAVVGVMVVLPLVCELGAATAKVIRSGCYAAALRPTGVCGKRPVAGVRSPISIRGCLRG